MGQVSGCPTVSRAQFYDHLRVFWRYLFVNLFRDLRMEIKDPMSTMQKLAESFFQAGSKCPFNTEIKHATL